MTQTDVIDSSGIPAIHSWRRLAIPVAALALAAGFVALATLQWDSWMARLSLQTTNDAYVRAEMTRLSSRVAGAIKSVDIVDFQRVKAGDLLIQIDSADYDAQVAQAKAAVVSARAALDNLGNQVELQNATIAQAEAQRVSLQALELAAQHLVELASVGEPGQVVGDGLLLDRAVQPRVLDRHARLHGQAGQRLDVVGAEHAALGIDHRKAAE